MDKTDAFKAGAYDASVLESDPDKNRYQKDKDYTDGYNYGAEQRDWQMEDEY